MYTVSEGGGGGGGRWRGGKVTPQFKLRVRNFYYYYYFVINTNIIK